MNRWLKYAGYAALALAPVAAFAAGDALQGEVKKAPLNVSAIVMFFAFVAFTLGITYRATRRTR